MFIYKKSNLVQSLLHPRLLPWPTLRRAVDLRLHQILHLRRSSPFSVPRSRQEPPVPVHLQPSIIRQQLAVFKGSTGQQTLDLQCAPPRSVVVYQHPVHSPENLLYRYSHESVYREAWPPQDAPLFAPAGVDGLVQCVDRSDYRAVPADGVCSQGLADVVHFGFSRRGVE